MPAKTKILKQLSALYLVRNETTAPGNTTLDADALAGQNIVTVADTTNFAIGDTVRIGAGEEMELGVVEVVNAGVSLELEDDLIRDHVSGEDCVEQRVLDLGDVTDGGVSVGGNAQTSDVQASTKRLAYTVLNGYTDLTADFALPGFTLHNFVYAVAAALASVVGDGSSATPFSYATDGNDFGAEQNQSLIAIGLTQDGAPIRVELFGVDFDYTVVSVQLRRGQLASVPMRAFAAAGGVVTTNASSYVPNVSLRPTKGKVFDSLEEVGFFAAATVGPLSTTTTGAVAAGVSVIPLTAVTNLVQGDWIQISSGDTAEFHQVESIAALNATLKTPLLHAHATATAVVRQQQVSAGGIHEDGVTVAITGSVEPIRLAQHRTSVGLKLGAASIALSFGVTDFSLANFARALGIPQASIASGRLVLGNEIATDVVEGVYVRGVLQDGTVAYLNAWGCSQDVSAFVAVLTQQGTQQLPIRLKPSSGLHLQQTL